METNNSNVCRACRCSDRPLTNFFDGKLPDLFHELTGIELDPVKNAQIQICLVCEWHIISFDEFKSMCWTSQKHFIALEDPRKKFPCKDCSLSFDSKSSVLKHWTGRHGLKTTPRTPKPAFLTCGHCGERVERHLFAKHRRHSHPEVRKYNCSQCGHSFRGKSELRVHERAVHSATKRFICDLCDGKFSDKDRIYKHMVAVHSELRFKIKCFQCTLKFHSISALQKHLPTHREVRTKFICPICDRMLRTNVSLQIHIYSHTSIDAYTCPVENCGDGHCKRQGILKHLRVRHGIENYGHIEPNPIDIEELKRNFLEGLPIKPKSRKRKKVVEEEPVQEYEEQEEEEEVPLETPLIIQPQLIQPTITIPQVIVPVQFVTISQVPGYDQVYQLQTL